MLSIQMNSDKQIKEPKSIKQEEKISKKPRPRFKEYRCTFPGCNDGLKTKYNCLSHIWDIHLRDQSKNELSYKAHKDKTEINEKCAPYLFFDESTNQGRQRRPYDNADIRNKQMFGMTGGMTNANTVVSEWNGNGYMFVDMNVYGGQNRQMNVSNDNNDENLLDIKQQQDNQNNDNNQRIQNEEIEQMNNTNDFGFITNEPESNNNNIQDGIPLNTLFVNNQIINTSNNQTLFAMPPSYSNSQEEHTFETNQCTQLPSNTMSPQSSSSFVMNQMNGQLINGLNNNYIPHNFNGNLGQQQVYMGSNDTQEATVILNDQMKQQYIQYMNIQQQNSNNSQNTNNMNNHNTSSTQTIIQQLPQINKNEINQYNEQLLTQNNQFTSSNTSNEYNENEQNIQPIPNQISLNPCAYQLLTNHENFIQVLTINDNLKRLHVMGEVFAENGFLQRSDKRYKSDIKSISNALNTILQLTGKTYKYRNDNRTRYGFIAQEVKEIIPEVVKEDEDGMLSIDPLSLLPFIIESLKTLHYHFSQLQNETMKTNEIKQTIKTSLETIKDIDQKEKNIKSLGPKNFVLLMTICSFVCFSWMTINVNFPFIWAFLLIAFASYLVSYSLCKEGKWNNFSIKGTIIILNIGLCSIAMTFLMGTMSQIFLEIHITFALLLVMLSLKIKSSCTWGYVAHFICGSILCGILFIWHPTFNPQVETQMEQNLFYPEYRNYLIPNDVSFEYKGELPWNCMNPQLIAKGNKMNFKNEKNMLVTTAENVDNIQYDKIYVGLKCSSIYFSCGEFNVAMEQDVCLLFEKNQTTTQLVE